MKKILLVLVAVVLAGCVTKKEVEVLEFTDGWPIGFFIAPGHPLNAGDTLIYRMKKDTTGEILEAEFVRFSPKKALVLLTPIRRGLVFWSTAPTQGWVREHDIRVLDVLPVVPRVDSCKQTLTTEDSLRFWFKIAPGCTTMGIEIIPPHPGMDTLKSYKTTPLTGTQRRP